MSTPLKILVVDDDAVCQKLLETKLSEAGFQVTVSGDGKGATEAHSKGDFDLIILDMHLPDISGLEVCKKIRSGKHNPHTPILFITAAENESECIKGLSEGGNDYALKPIQPEGIIARIKKLLEIREMHKHQETIVDRLEELRRDASLGAATQGIAHNLNNLLGVAVGYLDMLKSSTENPEMLKKSIAQIDESVNRMVEVIQHLTLLAKKQPIKLSEIKLKKLIEDTFKRCKEETSFNPETVTINYNGHEGANIMTNPEVMENAIAKLLINAWESYPKQTPDNQRPINLDVQLSANDEGEELKLEITDKGEGLKDSIEKHAFEPFITTKNEVGRGIGLTVARHAIRNLGGSVSIESCSGGGVCSRITYTYSNVPLLG